MNILGSEGYVDLERQNSSGSDSSQSMGPIESQNTGAVFAGAVFAGAGAGRFARLEEDEVEVAPSKPSVAAPVVLDPDTFIERVRALPEPQEGIEPKRIHAFGVKALQAVQRQYWKVSGNSKLRDGDVVKDAVARYVIKRNLFLEEPVGQFQVTSEFKAMAEEMRALDPALRQGTVRADQAVLGAIKIYLLRGQHTQAESLLGRLSSDIQEPIKDKIKALIAELKVGNYVELDEFSIMRIPVKKEDMSEALPSRAKLRFFIGWQKGWDAAVTSRLQSLAKSFGEEDSPKARAAKDAASYAATHWSKS